MPIFVAESMESNAQVVLGCSDLDATVDYFTNLGFTLETIFPADRPRIAILGGFGLHIRLDKKASASHAVIRIEGAASAPANLTAPNGTRIDWVDIRATTPCPEPEPRSLVYRTEQADWSAGRAGMGYRDLVPDRLDGLLIASHIRIARGGPVADYVHYHDVRFQLIYCYRGWVKLVYQDQGEPFVMHAGDCVLQPPGIRHRVLECSPGLEVIEVGCPAEHQTHTDPAMILPNDRIEPERAFGGQRFVWHRRELARELVDCGIAVRDLGIAEATAGLVDATVCASTDQMTLNEPGRWVFWFVLEGCADLSGRSEPADPLNLTTTDCGVTAPNDRVTLTRCAGAQVLRVTFEG